MKRFQYTPLSRRTFIGRFALGAAAVSFPSLSLRGATAKPKKLGLALIGLGNYSDKELGPALKETEFVRLAGVVTGTRELAGFDAPVIAEQAALSHDLQDV